MRVHDGVHRLAESVSLEPVGATGQTHTVDHRDEPGEIVVGAGPRVVLVGLEPIGEVVTAWREVLAPAIVTVRAGPVFQRRAPDITAVRLVQVTPVIRAEVIFQESLIDLLDDGEQAEVSRIEGQLRVGVPRRRHPRATE